MHLFMPCKMRTQTLLAIKETVEKHGGVCTMHKYESAEKLRRTLRETPCDAVVSAESAVFSRLPRTVPTVYVGTEFFCADKRLPPELSAYWVAHEDLSFEFMTRGARDKHVRVCGEPLRETYRARETRAYACRALGVGEDKTVFSVWTDGVSPNEIKATVRAVRTRSPEAITLLWSDDAGRRAFWQSAFAADTSVFVPDADARVPLSLAAADAVCMPASAFLVCAAARQEKIVILLHAAAPRMRKNAAFLDARGVAFCGKTAADNVSFACRLLSSDRLRHNMLTSQEKYIVRDAEDRAEKYLEEIAGK